MSTDFELVKQLYDGFNARDMDAVLAKLDTKFWSPSGCIFLTVYSD